MGLPRDFHGMLVSPWDVYGIHGTSTLLSWNVNGTTMFVWTLIGIYRSVPIELEWDFHGNP